MEKKKYIAPDIEVIEMEKSYFLTGSLNKNVVGGQAAYENWENLPDKNNIMKDEQKLEIDNKGSDYNLWGDM